jgi:hypothetical protein
VTQRERARQKKHRTHRKERQTESAHRRCSFGRVHRGEREREREVQRDISRGGELERSDVFPRATRKERRSGTETFRRENERRDHGED